MFRDLGAAGNAQQALNGAFIPSLTGTVCLQLHLQETVLDPQPCPFPGIFVMCSVPTSGPAMTAQAASRWRCALCQTARRRVPAPCTTRRTARHTRTAHRRAVQAPPAPTPGAAASPAPSCPPPTTPRCGLRFNLPGSGGMLHFCFQIGSQAALQWTEGELPWVRSTDPEAERQGPSAATAACLGPLPRNKVQSAPCGSKVRASF